MKDNNCTPQKITSISPRQLFTLVFLSWLSMLGTDFFLHAGLLAKFYLEPSPFLLPPTEAFQRIPLGYISFLLSAALLLWLMLRLKIEGWRAGLIFGLELGGLVWGTYVVGLLSISTANPALLLGWLVGQTFELGIAGAVAGSGLAGSSLGRLSAKVVGYVVGLLILTILLQSLGFAPAQRL